MISGMTALSIDIWGPKAWGFLHACSFTYPDKPSDEDRIHMYNLLNSLGYVLPCTICRKHFKEMFTEFIKGPTSHIFDNRLQVSKWLVDAHNEVNIRNGKEKMAYEDVEKLYVKSSSVCSLNNYQDEHSVFVKGAFNAAIYFIASIIILIICICLSRFVFKCKGISCSK